MSLGSSWYTHARELASKNFLFMHGKKVLWWEVQFIRKNLICVSKHKLLHVTKLESLLGTHLLLMCATTGLPSSGPSLHAVILFFFNKILSLFFTKFFWENLGHLCFLSAFFFLENFEFFLILQSCKENPGSQCLFFSFLFCNFWCCSSNIYPNLAILRMWFLTIFFFFSQKQRIC